MNRDSTEIEVTPELQLLLEQAAAGLMADAIVLCHESGQILAAAGDMDQNELPGVAALVSGMIAAGTSLYSRGDKSGDNDLYLIFGNSRGGCYAVQMSDNQWVFSIHRDVENPGLYRMLLRKLVADAHYLSVEIPDTEGKKGPKNTPASHQNNAIMAPNSGTKLFGNLSDEEIDRLFDQ